MQLPRIVRRSRRLGRGIASKGAKSGRGMKGQRSRAGMRIRAGFEGGQTPLYQRVPKRRGAKQIFASQVVHPFELTMGHLESFDSGEVVGPGALRRAGLIARHDKVKLIGRGVIYKKLTVRVHAVTESARQCVEKAGGKVEIIESKSIGNV
jgi:large subunit ribosomal protein L15